MRAALISFAIGLMGLAGSGISRADIGGGDRAWTARAERLVVERLAAPGRIQEAIGHYRTALEADPRSLEARWKLLRALHYTIDFTSLSEEEKDARLDEAVALASESIEDVDTDRPSDRARLFFWKAIAWGTRAQRVGLLTIVREGAARRMHDAAEQSLVLDPSVEEGGALRLLSRLNATLPRVPFVSGWVNRDEALPQAERAMALAPEHPGNRLILALTLLERDPGRRDEARRLLERVADSEPRPDFRVEDLAIREQASQRLEALNEEP